MKRFAQQLRSDLGTQLAIGLVLACALRGGLFFLSFGVFDPAVGIDPLGGVTLPMVPDIAIAALLFGAAVAGILSASANPDRGARWTYALGWIFLVDNLVYAATTAHFYLTSGEADAPTWFAFVPGVLQIPLILLSIAIIRSSRHQARGRSHPSGIAVGTGHAGSGV